MHVLFCVNKQEDIISIDGDYVHLHLMSKYSGYEIGLVIPMIGSSASKLPSH